MCDQGRMTEATRARVVERDGRLALLRNVPVLACDACGEAYVDPEVAKQLDAQFRRLLAVPVEYVVGQFEAPPTGA
jgi:YgiT-type zinc finger domain-containing protein